MKNSLLILVLLSAFFPLFALDRVTFLDGSTFEGEVCSYASLGEISLLGEDGSILTFPSKEVLSIAREGALASAKGNAYIQYHAGERALFTYMPPRYTYRGMSYNIDTSWGTLSDVGEFFAYLQEEHPDLDEHTLSLISELNKGMRSQNISMGIAGICIGVGTVMTFLPLNLDDLALTPPWAVGVSLTGFSLSVVGLATMVCNLFKQYGEYPPLIADSFNAYISGKNTPYP